MTARNGAAAIRGLARAACVLLALAALSPMPAQAQIQTYIGNLRSTFASGSESIPSGGTSQAFETGSRTGGYPLQEVVLNFASAGNGTVTVTIRESQNTGTREVPDDVLYTLTSPASLKSGENTFTAPSGAMLEADTVYHVVAQFAGSCQPGMENVSSFQLDD